MSKHNLNQLSEKLNEVKSTLTCHKGLKTALATNLHYVITFIKENPFFGLSQVTFSQSQMQTQ